MQTSDKPSLIPVPFANSGTKNTIPTDPPVTAGLASLELGFPPVTMTPIQAGGIPPAGQDFNGILYLISAVSRWANAGGGYGYDSGFSTEIGGYPKGATLLNAAGDGFWISLTDNNTADPDAGGAGWVPAFNQGITAVTGLTNANVTLTAAQAAKPIITLAGTLTANIQIIFPTTQQQWLVVNGTTGNFTVTCKTAAGTGVVIDQAGGARIYGDGTNIALPAAQVGTATKPEQAVQLGQVQQNYAWNHGFQTVTSTSNFTVPANIYFLRYKVWGGGGGGGGVGSAGAASAGGGGSGGFSEGVIAVTPGLVISCAIGAAGTAGGAGGSGGTGGTTSFTVGATTISCAGGVGGGPNGATGGAGGAGGSATGGQNNLTGAFGNAGFPTAGVGGSGAAAPGGGGGTAGSAYGIGATGNIPGGGGAGLGSSGTGSGSAGGRGQVNFEW